MANWSNPTLTSLYTDFVTEVKNRDVDLALGLDPATTSPTNVPTNAIRWNSASFKYQKWDGSTWNDLSAKYIFTAVEVSGATVPVNGMYLSTTNTLNFSTASTASRLTIDGSGNVNIDSGTFYVDAVGNRTGVNNTSPGSYNAAADDLVVGLTGDTGVTIASTNQGSIFFADGTTGGAQQAAGYLYYLHSNDSMGFGTANTLRMTLDASGNLGLGVVPSAWDTTGKALQFGAGAVYSYSTGSIGVFQNAIYSDTFRYVNTAAASRYTQVSGQHQWYTAPSWNGTGSNAITFTQAMTLDASGNLGVGSTSISPAYGYNRVIEVAGGFPGIKFAPSGASTFGFQIGAGTGGFQFYDVAAATERARIDSSGRVGIGTTSPQGILDLAGTSRLVADTSGATPKFTALNAAASAQVEFALDGSALAFRTLGAEKARIDSSGRLLVGTSSSPSAGTGQYAKIVTQGYIGSDTSEGVISIQRGTAATSISSGQALGALVYGDSAGNTFGSIYCYADAATGSGDYPGRLVFSTTADGAASPTERLRINNLGYMQGTVNGLGAGRIPAKQYYRLDSAFTGTNGTAAQPIYGVGVTLIGSTVYEFEAIYAFSRSAGSTSHTMSFLFGGTATINNIFYTGVGPGDGILPPLSTYDGGPASFVATSAGASVATAAMTIGTGIFYIVKGTVSINAGGTFIPQYQLSAAPGGAYSTYAGAYFSIWPLAASGAAVNIGSWA